MPHIVSPVYQLLVIMDSQRLPGRLEVISVNIIPLQEWITACFFFFFFFTLG